MLPTLLNCIFRVYDNGSRRVLEIRSEGSIPSTLTRIVRVSFKVGTIPEIPCVSISQWYVMKPEPNNILFCPGSLMVKQSADNRSI